MMKRLNDIARYKGILSIHGNDNPEINQLVLDSRQITKGDLFFAVKGTGVDAHQFIPQVIEKGCSVIVCSTLPQQLNDQVTYVLVDDVQQSVGYFASAFYNEPSKKLKLIGITGTNGKTTTSTMLFNLVTGFGHKCGLISTVEYIIGDKAYNSTHTTPDPIKLNALLAEMVSNECTYCFMEVSSHSVVQGRINGLDFDGGIFTNITHDHLDYHGTFDNYIKAKKGFFDQLSEDAFALTNADDRNGKIMLQNSKASKYTYAIKGNGDFKCRIMESDFEGLLLRIDNDEVWFSLVGEFNAYNLLAVYAAAFLLGFERDAILTKLSGIGRVNGRFEVYRSKTGIVGIVDYAHTPDALENVLRTINDIRSTNESLVTVVGCGGNRDKEKRPVMGKVAALMSDKLILTSDNPRNEDPDAIILQMSEGVEVNDKKKVLQIKDRKEAIRAAVMLCKPKDILLIAGKGHETYQEIAGVKHPFDDRVILKEIFNQL
ncbi:MAG TPA: UDP-N-acetylmuramoyl-L-alanyl-D-glutamate--2,6-diaminopimelate ligase [Bacteroidia bacterium]